MFAKVTPPADLQPAIDDLSPEALEFLKAETKGREILPLDLARAKDFERGELVNG